MINRCYKLSQLPQLAKYEAYAAMKGNLIATTLDNGVYISRNLGKRMISPMCQRIRGKPQSCN
jgi:hypothetical protein